MSRILQEHPIPRGQASICRRTAAEKPRPPLPAGRADRRNSRPPSGWSSRTRIIPELWPPTGEALGQPERSAPHGTDPERRGQGPKEIRTSPRSRRRPTRRSLRDHGRSRHPGRDAAGPVGRPGDLPAVPASSGISRDPSDGPRALSISSPAGVGSSRRPNSNSSSSAPRTISQRSFQPRRPVSMSRPFRRIPGPRGRRGGSKKANGEDDRFSGRARRRPWRRRRCSPAVRIRPVRRSPGGVLDIGNASFSSRSRGRRSARAARRTGPGGSSSTPNG